jgi:signal transduction histidine kinase
MNTNRFTGNSSHSRAPIQQDLIDPGAFSQAHFRKWHNAPPRNQTVNSGRWSVVASRRTLERQLAAALAEIDRSREKERKQIADDLHDHLGQNLVLASMKLGILATSASNAQLGSIEDVRQLISESLDQVRSLITGLCLPQLCDPDLGSALGWLLGETQKLYGLRCTPNIAALPAVLDHESQRTLLAAVRELLINVAKHAGVKEARVSIQCEERKIIASVADRGCGFGSKQEASLKTLGLGLIRLRERVARLGGSFRIDSRPGQGTKATIKLPIKDSTIPAATPAERLLANPRGFGSRRARAHALCATERHSRSHHALAPARRL